MNQIESKIQYAVNESKRLLACVTLTTIILEKMIHFAALLHSFR